MQKVSRPIKSTFTRTCQCTLFYLYGKNKMILGSTFKSCNNYSTVSHCVNYLHFQTSTEFWPTCTGSIVGRPYCTLNFYYNYKHFFDTADDRIFLLSLGDSFSGGPTKALHFFNRSINPPILLRSETSGLQVVECRNQNRKVNCHNPWCSLQRFCPLGSSKKGSVLA